MKTEKPKKLIRWYILGAIGAVLTILAAGIVVPALPYLLSFPAPTGCGSLCLPLGWERSAAFSITS